MPDDRPAMFQDVIHPRGRTPFWKVLIGMALVILVVGVRVCTDERYSREEREMRAHPGGQP